MDVILPSKFVLEKSNSLGLVGVIYVSNSIFFLSTSFSNSLCRNDCISSILYGSKLSSISDKIVIFCIFCSFFRLGNNLLTAKTTWDKNCLFNSIIFKLGLVLEVNGLILLSKIVLMLVIRVLLEAFICISSNKTSHSNLRFCVFVNCDKLLIIYIII